MNENYKITSVSYSSHTEIEGSDVVDFTNKIGVPHNEVTYLRAHISFEYILGGKLQYGTCYTDIIKTGTVVYDMVGSEIKAVSYIAGDTMPSASELNEIYEGIVANEYNAIAIEALKYNYSQEYLSEVGAFLSPAGCLTFRSPNPFTLEFPGVNSEFSNLEYSTTGTTWTVVSKGETVNSGSSNGLYVRGTGNIAITGATGGKFTLTGADISISGNIETLLDYQTVDSGHHPIMNDRCYINLFKDNSGITNIDELELPATTLVNSCYYSMFQGCTGLISIPTGLLPATTLAYSCYRQMFYGCTSLTNVPNLPATVLDGLCYEEMFKDCTSLINIPELSATTLANSCYRNMFSYCTSIKLSSTQIGDYQILYRVPSSSTGTDATNALLDMFSNTGGTFTGTPTINTTYYTSNQVI